MANELTADHLKTLHTTSQCLHAVLKQTSGGVSVAELALLLDVALFPGESPTERAARLKYSVMVMHLHMTELEREGLLAHDHPTKEAERLLKRMAEAGEG